MEGLLVVACGHTSTSTSHAACLLNFWYLQVLVQVASEGSRWDAIPTPPPPVLTPHTRLRVSCLPGLDSGCTQLPHSGPDAVAAVRLEEGRKSAIFFIFKDGLQASWPFRDLVLCDPFYCVPYGYPAS